MKKALISGVSGQDGSYLAELLLDKGYEVFGVIRRVSTPNVKNVQHLLGNRRIHLVDGDITDLPSLISIMKEVQPDEIYNLAAQSFVAISWSQPVLTCNTTGMGALNVFEAARIACPEAKIYQASSSEMYSGLESPQTEDTPFSPRSPYGVAKCFTGDTKIYTDQGLKPIKEIKINDFVWTHKGRLRRVTDVYKRSYKNQMVNIRVISGSKKSEEILQSNFQTTMTPEHPVLTYRGWKTAGELVEGELVAVVAKECKNCGKLIPAVQSFCSSKCNSQYQWKYNKEYRDKITFSVTERERKFSNLHTPEAKEKRLDKLKLRLQKQGPNHMEYYIDLLIQQAAPGFFRFVGDGQIDVGGLIPDWINEKEKAIIEFIGWGEDLDRRREQLEKKLEVYYSMGYRVLVLYGSEFKSPDVLKNKIANFVSSLGSVQFIFWPIKEVKKYDLNLTKTVYNLEVEEDHSYVANGIAVHNCFAHNMAHVYKESYGMFIVSGILYNHESPRRGIEFVTQKIVDTACRQYLGENKLLEIGNIFSCRDWSHSKDMCNGMYLMLQRKEPKDYILASGETHSVKDFIDITYASLGINLNWKDLNCYGSLPKARGNGQTLVKCVEKYYRPNEVNVLLGNPIKAEEELKWERKFNLIGLIDDMIDSKLTELKGGN